MEEGEVEESKDDGDDDYAPKGASSDHDTGMCRTHPDAKEVKKEQGRDLHSHLSWDVLTAI